MIEIALAAVVAVGGVGGVGVGLAWLNDRRHAAKAARQPVEDPIRVLETRFAVGEIDEDEFNRRASRLRYGPPLELD